MSSPEDSPGQDAPLAPAASPVPVHEDVPPPRAARPRWRKWLVYSLAGVGALAIVLIALVVVLVIHDKHTTAPAIDRDAQVESVMTDAYGKYSESDKGWLYVEPNSKTTWLMQVIQRAKVDLPDTTVKGNTALYFVASGHPLSATDARQRMLGLFVIQPDPAQADSALVQISEPYVQVDGLSTIAPQDVRFEALSRDTWGWVVKVPRDDTPQPGELRVDNRVYAPHDGHIVQLAVFPASGRFDEAAGCVTPASAKAAAEKYAVDVAASAALAASATASNPEGAEQDDAYDEEVPVADCLDHAWTYRTGAMPAQGLVEFLVTGGGLVRGEHRPVKTFKLVFDPKSFTYLVPDELTGF